MCVLVSYVSLNIHKKKNLPHDNNILFNTLTKIDKLIWMELN